MTIYTPDISYCGHGHWLKKTELLNNRCPDHNCLVRHKSNSKAKGSKRAYHHHKCSDCHGRQELINKVMKCTNCGKVKEK